MFFYDDVVDSNKTPSDNSHNLVTDMFASSAADEGYVEEIGNDGLKKYVCFTCKKNYKNKSSVKQHITSLHKALKRQRDKNVTMTTAKKPLIDSNLDTLIENEDLDVFCDQILQNQLYLNENTFLGDSCMNSTRIGEVSFLKADQDHDYLIKEQEKEESDGLLLDDVEICDVGEEDIITFRTQINKVYRQQELSRQWSG